MPDRTLAGWGYIYDATTGELISAATVIADPLPPALGLLELAAPFDPATQEWRPLQRAFLPINPAVLLTRLIAERNALNVRIAQLGGI
jgi:hypothetical protein